uniref:Uncharacterized protein n=1 Tax=Mus spicilegus TaxID=10103 RepID=A0A8C6MQA0_MUSSI
MTQRMLNLFLCEAVWLHLLQSPRYESLTVSVDFLPDIDTFEDSIDDDLDIDHLDDDDVENELEIHNTYEDNSENDLGSVTSVHTFELDTDSNSDEMETVPVGPPYRRTRMWRRDHS